MKLMRTYSFLIIINILFIGCDFEEIDSFEMPSWNWPLSFPLIDENYTFGAMGANDNGDGIFINGEGEEVESNNIFFDEDSILFIEYSAELAGENGDPIGVNNQFSSYFEITPPSFDNIQGIDFAQDGYNINFDLPAIPFTVSLPLALVVLDIAQNPSDDINQDNAILLSTCYIFQESMVGDNGYSLPDNLSLDTGDLSLPFTEEIFNLETINANTNDAFNSIDYITIDSGSVKIELTNNYPFAIDELEVTFLSNNETLFLDENNQNTFIFNNINSADVRLLEFTISNDKLVNLGSELTIDIAMFVDDLEGQGAESIYAGVGTGFGVCNILAQEDTWFLCNDNPTEDPPQDDFVCTNSSGQAYNPLNELDVDLDFQINFERVKSMSCVLNLEPIEVTENVQIQDSDQGNEPSIDVVGGRLKDDSEGNDDDTEFVNKLSMNIENNLFSDVEFSIEFPNFSSEDGEILKYIKNISVGEAFEDTLDFSGYYLFNAILDDQQTESLNWIPSPGTTLENIIVITKVIIDNQTVIFDLSENYGLNINSLSFAPLELEYVTAAAENLEFDVPPFSMENVPSGFEGFEFADLSLTFDIKNQIGIPVALDLNLTGKKENGDSVTLIIDPVLAYNNVDIDDDYYIDDGSSVKDSARTIVIFDKNGQTTKKYTYSNEWVLYQEETIPAGDGVSTIIDVMSIAPDEINVSGGAAISGNGILAPETYLWGDFIMQSALSFVFSKNISFIPGEPTVLEPLDESTRSKIDSSLVIAKLSLDIINSIPIDGNIGLLVSDYNPDSLCISVDDVLCSETYFPVYFDDLTNGDWISQSGEISEGYESEFSQDSLLMEYLEVSKISVDPLDDDETSIVNFLNEDGDTLFFIGRMFNLEIAEPDSINTIQGTTIVPSVYTDEIILDTNRVSWITSDQQIFLKPLIRFNATDDYYCNDGSECVEGICNNGSDCIIEPRTFQTSNSINISSFITFTLNTGSLFETTKNTKLSEFKKDNVNN